MVLIVIFYQMFPFLRAFFNLCSALYFVWYIRIYSSDTLFSPFKVSFSVLLNILLQIPLYLILILTLYCCLVFFISGTFFSVCQMFSYSIVYNKFLFSLVSSHAKLVNYLKSHLEDIFVFFCFLEIAKWNYK